MDSLVVINATDAYTTHLSKYFLLSYRGLVNHDLIYMNINTVAKEHDDMSSSMDGGELRPHSNDFYLCGFSEQIFQCLASMCNGGGCRAQVDAVENIDKKHNLPKIQPKVMSDVSTACANFAQTIQTQSSLQRLRVFISSTFEVMCLCICILFSLLKE